MTHRWSVRVTVRVEAKPHTRGHPARRLLERKSLEAFAHCRPIAFGEVGRRRINRVYRLMPALDPERERLAPFGDRGEEPLAR